jgi:hypothetical protein
MTAPMRLPGFSFVPDASKKFARVDHTQMRDVIDAFGPSIAPAPVSRYPMTAQFDLRVEDDCIDRVARRGDYLRCVDPEMTEIEIDDGDLVVIATHNGDETRLLARRLHRLADRTIFSLDCANPARADETIVVMKSEAQNAPIRIFAKALFAWSRVAD